jgi:hypothetical protein
VRFDDSSKKYWVNERLTTAPAIQICEPKLTAVNFATSQERRGIAMDVKAHSPVMQRDANSKKPKTRN